jgi:hypothetical protein
MVEDYNDIQTDINPPGASISHPLILYIDVAQLVGTVSATEHRTDEHCHIQCFVCLNRSDIMSNAMLPPFCPKCMSSAVPRCTQSARLVLSSLGANSAIKFLYCQSYSCDEASAGPHSSFSPRASREKEDL